MKSLLVYLCLLCFFSLNARAQFILQEDFQQGIPGTWALINNDSRIPDSATNFVTDAWVAISDSSDTTDIIAVSTSKYSPAGAADDWLITPLLSLGSNGILTWYARAFSSTAADGYQVRISTTTPTIAGFNALAPLFSTSEENTSWTKHSVDLAAAGYSNQTVYIAFRNNSNDKYLLALDDVTVFDCNSLNADAGVIDTSTTVSCAGAPALDLNLSPVYLSPAGGNTISGNTNDVPNWDPLPGRPFEDGGCCASASPPYQIVAFQVSESGNYDIVQVQTGYDGMMFIYTDPLDLTIQVPLNPGFAAGMTYVTGNDDGDSIGVSEILSLHLTQGETYYLISTGFDSTSFGDYTTTFTGPGIILIDNRNIADLPFDYNYVVSNSSDVIVSIGDDLTNETTFPGSVSGATFSVCGVSYVEANLDLSQYIGQTLASFTSDISSNNCADITPACHKAVIFSEGTADAGTADTVCAGNSVTLIASGGIAYSWSTGDTTASITVTPSTTTPYSVTVTNSLGCTATDVVTAFVYAADAGVFNSAPLSACSGDPRLLLTLNPEFSKNFSLSGNNTITGNTLKYFTWFPLDGRPFEDGACCTQNNSPYNINPFRVDVEGDYKITQHQQGYDGLIFLYTDPFDLTANPPVTFIDANDDSSGVVGVSAINSVFLNPSKTYYLVSTGLNAGNYGNYTTAFIGPGNVLLPVAPDSALFGFEYIIVDNTSTITSFGTDLSNVVSYPGSASGTSYQVCSVSYLEDSVDISNYLGSPLADLLNEDCLDVSDNCKVVTIFTNPSASIFTPNQTVCFTDTISISGNVPAVGTGQWTFFTGGGIIENIFLPTTRIYGLAAGMNTVAWTVNNGGCGDFDTMSIFVIKPPANAGMDDTVCRGGSVTLTASGGVSYSWNTGQTTASITFNAFITKSYTVTVTDGNGCSATDTVVVAVNLPPVVNIPDVTICPGSTTILDAGTPGSTYLWSTGSASQFISVNTPGTYSVTVTDNNGCTQSDSGTVSFGNELSVPIADTTLCDGDTLVLDAGNSGANYTWSTGEPSRTINVTAAGTYSVTVSDANNCTGTGSATVSILPVPALSAGNDAEICKGESTTLTATGSETNFLWSTGDSSASITVSPVQDATYTVTLTSANGCQATDDVAVTVHPLPAVNLGNDTSICPGGNMVLAASGGTQYLWNTGETSSSIFVSPISDEIFSVTVTTAFGCTGSDALLIAVKPAPTADAGVGDTLCAGESAILIASGGIAYLWSNGSTSSFITVAPAASTTYYVTVTAVNGCTDSDSVFVKVNPVPGLELGNDVDICTGSSHQLTASGGGSYLWNTGETTQSILVSPASDQIYSVTVTAAGCSATDMVTVFVRPIPVANAGADLTICSGEEAVLTASGGTDYHWSTGSNDNPLTVSPSATTTYSVTVSNAYGCEDDDEVEVTVNTTPAVILFGFDTTIYCMDHAPIIIGGSPVGGTLSGAGVSNGRFYPAIAGEGTHTISYSLTSPEGCTGVDSKDITVDLCIGIAGIKEPLIKIYPNPTDNSITIETSAEHDKPIMLKLFDIAGKNLLSEKITAEKQMIDVSDFAPGTYLLQITAGESTVVKQVTKIN